GPVALKGEFTLLLNTSSAPVVLSDGVTRLPAGSFLRVEATKRVTLTIGDVELGGKFAIEQATTKTGGKQLTLAISGLEVKFGSATILSEGQGVLLIVPVTPGVAGSGGYAGQFSGRVDLSALTQGAVTVAGTFSLAI